MDTHKKRVNVVTIKMVKERSETYDVRKVKEPKDIYTLIKRFLDDADREKLYVICFDTKNQPTNISLISIGSLNSSIVHPREVFKVAILSNAASIALAHNHPSGDISPSREDILITERIKRAGEMIGINLLDHIIIGDEKFLSLKDKCLGGL